MWDSTDLKPAYLSQPQLPIPLDGCPTFPGFPVEVGGVVALYAAFLNESRTRGRVRCCVTGNSVAEAYVGRKKMGEARHCFSYPNRKPHTRTAPRNQQRRVIMGTAFSPPSPKSLGGNRAHQPKVAAPAKFAPIDLRHTIRDKRISPRYTHSAGPSAVDLRAGSPANHGSSPHNLDPPGSQ